MMYRNSHRSWFISCRCRFFSLSCQCFAMQASIPKYNNNTILLNIKILKSKRDRVVDVSRRIKDSVLKRGGFMHSDRKVLLCQLELGKLYWSLNWFEWGVAHFDVRVLAKITQKESVQFAFRKISLVFQRRRKWSTLNFTHASVWLYLHPPEAKTCINPVTGGFVFKFTADFSQIAFDFVDRS